MKKYEQQEVMSYKQILVKTTCDICKKEISGVYYEVTTGHNDWCNDSVDSIEDYDVCSDECLKKKFNEYLDFKSDTKYINIEKA